MSVQQTARAAAESHKARDWANSLINRFEEQLPYKAGVQTAQTRLNIEVLKRNLVQISRHRFSKVVLKLAEFLKRIREGSTDSSNKVLFQQRQYYDSAIMLLDMLRRCLDNHQPETTTRHDTTVVKDKLLPEICQNLKISSDYVSNAEVKNLAIKVIYSLSSNFFAPIYGRISSRLTDLCKDDNQEYSDIELLQYLNLKIDSLIKFLQITIDKVQQMDRMQKDAYSKRSALSVWLSSLDKAINNWLEAYPLELANIQQKPNDELEAACSQLFDIIEPWTNQKKGQTASYLSLLALLLGLSPKMFAQLPGDPQRPQGRQAISYLERKHNFFCRMLSDLGDSSRPGAVAGIRLCKASSCVEPQQRSHLHRLVENKIQSLFGQLFGTEGRSFFSSKGPCILDLDVMIDCFLVCVRLNTDVDAMFQNCVGERSSVTYQFIVVSSLYKLVSKPQLPWWPKIDFFYPKSFQLRNLFSNTVQKLGYTLFPLKVGSGQKSKDQGRSKDRAEEILLCNNIMVYLVRLIREDPMLVLYNDSREKSKSTMSLFKNLAAIALTSPALDVSHEAQQALLVLHEPERIKEWSPKSHIDTFWDVSYEILMAISRNLADRRTDRDKDLLKWLRDLLNCRNIFLAKYSNYVEVRLQDESGKLTEMTAKIEEALFIHLWNIDTESVLTTMSCFWMLCEEAEICCGSDEVTTILPNYYLYLELSKTFTLLTTANKESKYYFYENSKGRKDLQDRILALFRKIEHCSPCMQQAWEQTSKYWLDAVNKLGEDSQGEQTRSAVKRRTSHQNSEHELDDRITEWAQMSGFLAALGGVYLLKNTPDTQQHQNVKDFVSRLLQLLTSNDKCREQMRRHIRDLVEFQMSSALYPIMFDTIQLYVGRFFDDQRQVQLSDVNTQFIEHAIFIMKCVLDKSEQQTECQDITNIEITTLTIVRYVRLIETSQAIFVKMKVCQLVEVMIKRRDYLRFRQEIKFRNKLVEYLSEWVMGSNNIHVPLDTEVYDPKMLDEACMRTISLLVYNLPLHAEDSDGGDVQAKKNFFMKYFTLFMNLLSDCNEALSEQKEFMTKQRLEAADKLNTLRDYTIQAMSNLLSANIDCGFLNSIAVWGYNRELETRAAFLEVLTKILQQGTEFDMLAETSRAELHTQLVQLVTMISDKGEIPIAMALATVVRADEMDELARVLVNVFESKHLLSPLLWNIFYREVSGCENVQTLFRGNSLGTKIMSLCCQLFGAEYLQKLLNPLIAPMLEDKTTSYEVDPAKLEPGADIERNRNNLIKLTNAVFDKIVSSVDSFPPNLRMMCHCLYQVLCKNYPSAQQNTGSVGTILFLRFINPAIVSPQKFGIVKVDELPHNVQRGLMFMSKILQNIANRIDFNKEQHMVYFNKMLREHQDRAHYFFIQISKDVETNIQADQSETYVTEPNHAALHRLLYTHQEGINNYLSSSRDHGRDVGRRPFDKLAILLAHLGEPQPKSADLDLLFPNNTYNPAWIKSDKFLKNIEEAVKNLDPHEKEEYKNLKQVNVFYQSGYSKKKHPVFYYIARRYNDSSKADVNINMLYQLVVMTLQPCWDSPFELVIDLTHVSPQNRFRLEYMEKWVKMSDSLNPNIVAVYFYNCNSYARDFIKFHGIGKNLGERAHFVNDTKKLEEFIDKEQQKLPGATVTLGNDLTIFPNVLKIANKDTKVTIKVGPTTIQVAEKSKILGQTVYVNDIYYVSEIDRVMVVDENQFALTKSDEALNFIHSECETIVQAILHIRNRWELSQPESGRVHPKIRPKDVPGTLLNMALLNLGSSNLNVRSAAYNLLCALATTFNLKINQQLHMTSGLCIPSNNTVFIKRVSEILAAKDSHLTLQFLEECIEGFRISSTELKHLCLEYMSFWLNNLGRFYKPSEEAGGRQKQVIQILEKLITLTIEEVEMLPSIQTKIWSTIGKLPELIDPVLENFIQRSLRYGIDSPMVEIMANTTVALASCNVAQVSERAIKLLEKVIKSTAPTPTTQLEQNTKWPEIAIHVRHLVLLSFNNYLDVGKHLPKLFHMITLLVCSGSLTMRVSVYGLVINVIHSLCTCTSPTFTEKTYSVLKMSHDEFSLPKFLQLFGISNVKSSTVNAFRASNHCMHDPWSDSERPEAISQDYEKFVLTNLEIITDAMLEIMEACSSDQLMISQQCKWLDEWTDLAKNFAFSHNRALKPRALIVYGCISKSVRDEDVKALLHEFVNALDRFDVMLLEAIVICLTRLESLLNKGSPIHLYLFWVALCMLQLENVSLYSTGLALLEQNLHILDNRLNLFKEQSFEQVIMATREPLESQFSVLDTKLGLSFKSNFHFALVGYLLKGYWHPNSTTVTRNGRVLTMLLDIVAKSTNKKDKFEVTPQNVAYLAALVPISDEVRKRCHLKNSFNSSVEEFGSPESSSNLNPPVSTTSSSSSPAKRRQKSWDQLDQTAITQAKQQKRLLHQRSLSVPSPKEIKDKKNRVGNALLNPDVLTDPLTRNLVLAVLATLVKHSTNDDQTRILYEYIAESSYVFEDVFPVIYNFLDQKISNIVTQSYDQRTFNAVQTIILNGIACEDTSNTQLHSLQHCNMSGLWRVYYTNSNNSPENAQYFLDLFKAMKNLFWLREQSHSSLTKRTLDSSRTTMAQQHSVTEASISDHHRDQSTEERTDKPDSTGQAASGAASGSSQP